MCLRSLMVFFPVVPLPQPGHAHAEIVDQPAAISGYPNVNAYAPAPGSRNVTSGVRSRTLSCWRTSW